MSSLPNKLIFITGGARSGKSALAERFARELGGRVTFMATAVVTDDEMRLRIEHHKRHRPADWNTVEEPLALDDALRGLKGKTDVILLDCLTVWLGNLLHAGEDQAQPSENLQQKLLSRVEELLAVIRESPFSVVVVSNEVGSGVVPPYSMGRFFRDVAGWANQLIARQADEVWLSVAGLPLRFK